MDNLTEILNSFLSQSQTNNLKTSDYPKNFLGLKMKTSFGQGNPARVSWISFLAPEMTTSEGFYPVYLYYKDKRKLILAYGVSETSEHPTSWPENIIGDKKKISDFLEEPPRYGSSFIFKVYIKEQQGFYYADNKKASEEDLNADLNQIVNQYKKAVDIEIKDEKSPTHIGLFFREKELENFIINNWNRTEFGKKYDLIFEDGQMVSQQYQTKIGSIDILAKDKVNKNYVVIELKKGQTSDDTIGQCQRYMGWVMENKKDKNVKGIIIAGEYDEKLKYAQKVNKSVDVFLYETAFRLKEFKE